LEIAEYISVELSKILYLIPFWISRLFQVNDVLSSFKILFFLTENLNISLHNGKTILGKRLYFNSPLQC
jgi:hypothetical protein